MTWEAASRAYLQALYGWSGPRLDAYLGAEDRMDSKSSGRRQCGTGYACGDACISRSKACRVSASTAGRGRLSVLLGGAATSAAGNAVHGPADEAQGLILRRDALLQEGRELLARSRDDGSGTLMENPTPFAIKAIERLGRRIAEVDQDLQRLDGKDPGRRRWRNGTPGLAEFSGHMAPPHPDTPGRVAYRKRLIEEALSEGSKVGKGAGGKPLAVVMMGGPASGKSTLMNKLMADKTGFVTVDPDGVKEKLPEYLLAVANSDKLAAARAHEESSTAIADVIKKRAIEGRYNVILDGTGKSGDKYAAMLSDLKAKGYEVKLVFPHLDKETALVRVAKRADRTGRFVPEAVVAGAYDAIPHNFMRFAALVDSAVMRDAASSDQNGRLTMEPIMEIRDGRIVSEEPAKAREFRSRFGGA